MSAQFWSASCFAAHERPISVLLNNARGVSGLLIAAFCCVCVANATCFILWKRLHRSVKCQIWHLFGWFSALAASGCFIGAFAFAANMMQLSEGFEANSDSDSAAQSDFHLLYEKVFRWKAVYVALFPLEFMCISIAKLLVLERLYNFVLPMLHSSIALRLRRFGFATIFCVVACNAIAVAANIAQAVHLSRAASLMQQAAANPDAAAANSLSASAMSLFHQQAQPLATLQSMCETTLLLVIIVAYAIMGVYSMRRINGALQMLAEKEQVQQQASAPPQFKCHNRDSLSTDNHGSGAQAAPADPVHRRRRFPLLSRARHLLLHVAPPSTTAPCNAEIALCPRRLFA